MQRLESNCWAILPPPCQASELSRACNLHLVFPDQRTRRFVLGLWKKNGKTFRPFYCSCVKQRRQRIDPLFMLELNNTKIYC